MELLLRTWWRVQRISERVNDCQDVTVLHVQLFILSQRNSLYAVEENSHCMKEDT